MGGKIFLYEDFFSNQKRTIFKNDAFCVTAFKYSSGVSALTIENSKGYVTVLPYMGQMIWDMEFLEHNLVMKSIFDEPEICYEAYGESYGCLLMHCGLTAMGVPSANDKHKQHGELPIAKYKDIYILADEDEKGKYISLVGTYYHKRAFALNYEFIPEYRLYENASTIDINIQINNKKDLPLEYFYLCHINYRPVDGAKLIYSAKHENIYLHSDVPSTHPKETRDYIERLSKDITIMDTVDKTTQSYNPEILFTCKYDADENGNAYTMQHLPDGYSCYVCHRPEELPIGVRWIGRTEDEDAMGMVLPATGEHKGYIHCKEHGYEKYINPGESVSIHINIGILSPNESEELKNKINNIR